jgi:hypothetical protein
MPMGRIRSRPSGTVARNPQPQCRRGGLHSSRGPLRPGCTGQWHSPAERRPTPQSACWARSHAVFALARCPWHGAGSRPRLMAAFGTTARLRHANGEATMQPKGRVLTGGVWGWRRGWDRRCAPARLAATRWLGDLRGGWRGG